MATIYIKNKKGTSNSTPPEGYSSWLNFWEKKKDRTATACLARNCDDTPDNGGHVTKAWQGGEEYILPLCDTHNSLSENVIYDALENDLQPVT